MLRMASANDSELCGHDGERWWPAITEAPVLAATLFDGDFTGSAGTASADLTVALDVLRVADERAPSYIWAGSPITIHSWEAGASEPVFVGRIDRFAGEGSALKLGCKVDGAPFEKSVLSASYAGTGGLEGGPDLKGRPKPWLFGRALNVEPVLLDAVDNVYQVSAYGSVSLIAAVYERGASFGASLGDHLSLAALLAADIPEGRWGTCRAQGLIRLGAPAYGVVTADVDGDTQTGFIRRTGDILTRIGAHLGITDSLNLASLDALDDAVPFNVNLYLTEQMRFLDLAQRMIAPCNAVAGIDWLGKLFACRVAMGEPTITLDVQGRQMPPVLQSSERTVSPPYKRIMLGAARSWRVHSFDEVAFYAELLDRGAYDPAVVYREGNIVTMPDGSRWLYIALVAQAGVLPGSDPLVWEEMSGAIVFNARGPYDPLATYAVGDLVFWRVEDGGDGALYVRIGEGETTGVDPSDTTKWQIFLEGGKGDPGPTLSLTPNQTAFTYVNGVLTPPQQTVIIDATLDGEPTLVDWSTNPSVKTAAGSATFTLTPAELGEHPQVVVTAAFGPITQSLTIFRQADSDATIGAPVGTPVGDRIAEEVTAALDLATDKVAAAEADIVAAKSQIDDLFLTYGDTASAADSAALAVEARDLTVQYRNAAEGARDTAIAQAGIAEDWAVIATDQAAAAQSNTTLTAQYRDQVAALVPENNPFFDAGTEGWAASQAGADAHVATASPYLVASYQGASNVLYKDGARFDLYSFKKFPVVAGRKYRLRYRFWAAGSPRQAVGIQTYGPDGTVGGNNGLSYVLSNGGVFSNGWHVLETLIIANNLTAGTTSVRLVALNNLDSGTTTGVRSDYFTIEDITDVVELTASVTSNAQALATLDTQYASLETTVTTQGATINQNATAISNLEGDYATLSSTVSTQGAKVNQTATALSDLETDYASLENTVSAQGVTVSQHTQAINSVEDDVASIAARWGVSINANGQVVGSVRLDGTATESAFTVTANVFQIVDPTGTSGRTEFSNGNHRVYDAAGILRVRMGVW